MKMRFYKVEFKTEKDGQWWYGGTYLSMTRADKQVQTIFGNTTVYASRITILSLGKCIADRREAHANK